MTTDDELKAKSIVDGWFWQMAEGHQRSMTIFYESAPLEADAIKLVTDYLKSRENVTELVVNNKKLELANYKTLDTWYQTAASEKWAGTDSTKIRLYWTLGEADEEASCTIENGCKYRVVHELHWNEASPPAASATASSSGVQKSIQGLVKDRTTGLWSYVIETRTTVQQDILLYKSAETAFKKVETEQHLGVKADDVAATGLAAGVTQGTRTERLLTKNPDCTTNIDNRKVTAKENNGAVTVEQASPLETRTTTINRNKASALVALTPGDYLGKEVMRRSEKTDEELWDQTEDTITPTATATDWFTWETTETGPRHNYTYECGLRVFRNQPVGQETINTLKLKNGTTVSGRVSVNASINRFGLLDGTITYSNLKSWTERSGASGVFGGIQTGSIKFKYVSDYTISTAADGTLAITPTTTEATIQTTTYYGHGNEGSEAAAATNQYPVPPGVRIGGRTYITSDTGSIITAIHAAKVKLETALANRKAVRA